MATRIERIDPSAMPPAVLQALTALDAAIASNTDWIGVQLTINSGHAYTLDAKRN